MKASVQFFRSAFLALLLAGLVAACDSTSALEDGVTSDEEIQLFVSGLEDDLSLSSAQSAALSASVSSLAGDGGPSEPGFLWRLSAELAATLTPTQIDSLINGGRRGLGDFIRDAAQNIGGGRPGGNGGGGDRPAGNPLRDILTDTQRSDIEAIRDARRDEVEALIQAIRDARQAGDQAAAQAAHEALRGIQEEVKAAVQAYLDANLTQEQQDAIAAAEAEREAARAERQAAERAVMIEVLAISDAQADELLAAVESFREAVRALDRSGDVASDLAALRADLHASVSATLGNDDAFLIWQIHEALAHRAHRNRGPGGKGRRGMGGRPNTGGVGG